LYTVSQLNAGVSTLITAYMHMPLCSLVAPSREFIDTIQYFAHLPVSLVNALVACTGQGHSYSHSHVLAKLQSRPLIVYPFVKVYYARLLDHSALRSFII
jgi:hypothetical protein